MSFPISKMSFARTAAILAFLVGYSANAGTMGPENDFLNSRLKLTVAYTEIDQQARDETMKATIFPIPLRYLEPFLEAKNFVRDAEVFLATRGTLEEAGFVLSGVAKVFPALPAALLGWLGSSSDKIIPEMISQTKSRLDKFYTRIDAFSISSPDAEERLRYHQQNFRDFLKARSDVDALFEEKSDAIANRHLSFSSVWNYGKDSSDLYKLELYHATAVISLDRAEEKYLEDSLLNISPLPAGWN